MEVEYEAGDTDLLMVCDEEEQEIWPPTPETDEKEKDEGEELRQGFILKSYIFHCNML